MANWVEMKPLDKGTVNNFICILLYVQISLDQTERIALLTVPGFVKILGPRVLWEAFFDGGRLEFFLKDVHLVEKEDSGRFNEPLGGTD